MKIKHLAAAVTAAAALFLGNVAHAQNLLIAGSSGFSIIDGSEEASVYDGTDFRQVAVDGGEKLTSYFATNLDSFPNVSITGPVTVTGPNASDFTVLFSHSEVVYQTYHIFYIKFNPSAAGLRTATVTVPNNSPGFTSSYSFTVSGTGVETVTPNPVDLGLGYTKLPKIKINTKTNLHKITATVDVGNLGSVDSTGGYCLFYLSEDPYLTLDDSLLNNIDVKPLIAAKPSNGGPKVKKTKVKFSGVLNNITSGYILALVIPNPVNAQDDRDFGNNLVAMPFAPGLKPQP